MDSILQTMNYNKMATNPNIVHQYFKKELEEGIILVQVNPYEFTGLELLVSKEGDMRKTEREFEDDIFDDLKADGFVAASAMEFNLYLKGLK
jgi:hypothetical protein